MKERGFIPLASVGLILLLLTIGVLSYYHLDSHRAEMDSVSTSAGSSLASMVSGSRSDLERQLRLSLYKSLWEVGKEAYRFESDEARENTIERLSAFDLKRRLFFLADQEKLPTSPDLKLGEGLVDVDVQPTDGGYPLALVVLPQETSFRDNLPDNSLSLELPFENLRATADARYFLLQDRMEDFGGDLGEIKDRWMYAEYVLAYLQAWTGKLRLGEDRSKALFQIALASYEIEKFGSADYYAIASDLLELGDAEELIQDFNSEVVVEPIKAGDIEPLVEGVSCSITHLRTAEDNIVGVLSSLQEVVEFDLETWHEEELDKMSDLRDRVDDGDTEILSADFRAVCDDFKSLYSLSKTRIDGALAKIRDAKSELRGSGSSFQRVLDDMRGLVNESPLIEQLYENFIQEGNPPGPALQVDRAVKNVLEKLDDIKERILGVKSSLQFYDELSGDFPSDFDTHFEDALSRGNRELAEAVLVKSWDYAKLAYRRFSSLFSEDLIAIGRLNSWMSEQVESQTEEPESNWNEKYQEYPEPGEDYEEDPVQRTAEKYVIRRGEGTIGGMEKVLAGVKAHLDRLLELGEIVEGEKGSLRKFEMNETLRQRLQGEVGYNVLEDLDRDEAYELSPPEPLFSDPGLSVYHEVDIEEVKYSREDPVGRVCGEPTPIYLWFIDTTLYFALWDVKIKLGGPIIEEIFDYRNQAIPRSVKDGSGSYVHKPLTYKQRFDRSEFGFRLAVVSLRHFSISGP